MRTMSSPATVLPFQAAGVWFCFSAHGQHSSVAALPAAGSGTPGTPSAAPAALLAAHLHPEPEQTHHCDCGCGGGREGSRKTKHIVYKSSIHLFLSINEPEERQRSHTMNGERSICLIGTGPVGGRGTEDEEPSLNTDTAVEWSAEKRQ